MKNPLDILRERGFLKQCTDEDGLRLAFDEGPQTFYVGIDPTGPSCHIGHMVPVYGAAHLQRAGHKPIILMGGGTARIGDPSGKTEMRKMISYKQITANIESITPQIARLIDLNARDTMVIDNAEWLAPLNYIEFLRDIGRHFSVNRMLTFESYRQRMDRGLSFIEFNYQLLQSYDFLELYRRFGCSLQIGGDDQWGNIVSGMELIRRVENGARAFGLTFPLIERSDGKKMGKSESGAVFLDPEATPVYDFYQYWRNVPDSDVERFLLIFTFLPVDECRELGRARDRAINDSKARLAFEVTRLIHGEDEALRVRDAAASVFSIADTGNPLQPSDDGLPSATLACSDFPQGIGIVDLFARSTLCASRSEARRLVQQGGAAVDGVRITDVDACISLEDTESGHIMLKAGKKRFFRMDVLV